MTKMGQDHWMDKAFREKLEGFEVQPNKRVWENISKHLDGERKRPPVVGYWKPMYWAILAGVILMGLAYWYFTSKDKSNPQPMELPFREPNPDESGVENLASVTSPTASSQSGHPKNELNNQNSSISPDKSEKLGLMIRQDSKSGKARVQLPAYGNEKISNPSGQEYNKQDIPLSSNVLRSTKEEIALSENQAQNTLLASTDPLFQGGPNSFFGPNPLSSEIEFKSKEAELIESAPEQNNQKSISAAEGCNVHRNTASHFYVDAYYAPELASRSFSANNISDLAYAEKRSATEKAIMSYTVGLRASVVFPTGIAARTGVQYSNNTERFDYIKETQTITIERKDKDGNVIGFETIVKEIMDQSYNHYKNVDIPIIIGYEKELKDFVLSVNTGLGINISSSQSGKIYQSDLTSIYNMSNQGEGNQVVYKNHTGISWIGSIGLNYKYNDKIMLMLEPSARYYLKSITDESYPLRQKYFFMGLNIGLRYKIH